ncbi:MAG: tetratricopeptide repeat protein [Deltaproteobacteria bacterium]|nr:tetratricopeptide repeat protein [Deltaproteobacteria bacterium]
MRAAIVAALLASAGVAHANPKTAPAPDKWVKAAREAFTQATEFDQKGDLVSALGLYTKAFEISPHPSCIYNIGDVHRRLGKIALAIKAFETYLALLPDAADRRDVEATIGKLAATPGTLALSTGGPSDPQAVTFKDAYVLVDGEIKLRPGTVAKSDGPTGRPGIDVQVVGAGDHVVEVVTAITYSSQRCRVRPGETERCQLSAKPRIDGRFVIGTGDRGLRVQDPRLGDKKHVDDTRFEIAPGKHRLTLRDRTFECPPLAIDVPAGGDVGYVFLSTREWERLERCRAIDVKALRLKFEP